MPESPKQAVMVSPVCHARPENIKKEQVLELFRPWLKKQIGIKARAGRLSTSHPMSKIKERKVTLNVEPFLTVNGYIVFLQWSGR
ncbi:MAG: hypothetical protein JRI72_11285 [Deltaproteobacteria bacterium]|nr:hypothetical protein [Deltaproteobacteria bacterium]